MFKKQTIDGILLTSNKKCLDGILLTSQNV